ncbi:MAG: Do family serine endopeptidase [Verrucomicrobiota bacterium]
MKNLAKFLLFVLLVSAGISLLYNYRLKHGSLSQAGASRAPEKYTLAAEANINPKEVASLEALNAERRALVKGVIPSVVAVKTSKKVAVRRQGGLDPLDFFSRNPGQFRSPRDEAMVQNSLGSGVIVTKEGHIVTNNHVVDQVDEIEVQLSDGRTKKARVVGADAELDIAVLKIDDPGVKPLRLADSDAVQVGDFVLAIGNPFGFEETVTDGIISSKGRPNRTDVFSDLLQTNAAINPGNSGGPLINLRGEVVGINAAIISRSGGSQGIGFAIPSNTVRTALESLLKQGRIIRGYLGIQTRALQPGQQNAPETEGVVVDAVVPGSPAAESQLQKGDIILKFDGHDVKNFPALRSLVAQTGANRKVDVEIVRNGKPMKVVTEIKEQPMDFQAAGPLSPQNRPQPPPDPGDQGDAENETTSLLGGIRVENLTPEMARRLDLPSNIHGVIIADVDPRSGVTEVQKGDVIEEIDQQPLKSASDFGKIASSLDSAQPHILSVCRHRTRSFVVLRAR